MNTLSRFVLLGVIIVGADVKVGLYSTQTPAPASVAVRANIPYLDAKPILEALREDLLPAPLQAKSPADLESAWPRWVSERDAQIRERLARGDQDSIVNLLLFGVTFTNQPRMRAGEVLGVARQGRSPGIVQGPIIQRRIEDLISGIVSPGTNERLQFVRQIIEARGIDPTTPAGKSEARRYLEEGLQRVLAEYEAYSLAPAPERSVRFDDRGLSSDTSILPDFAIEQALKAIRSEGLLGAGSVRRVGIVGPGLDFADKREGYDFYPQQTLQPFAVIDSLIRLGLADTNVRATHPPTPGLRRDLAGARSAEAGALPLHVTAFDLSPRVNQHLEAARQRARAGGAYVLQLPRDTESPWTPELVTYWERFGDSVGEEAEAMAPPSGLGRVLVRAVRVHPAVVLAIDPHDVNIVLQRLDPLAANDRFDLIIATNLLVYYDVFERSLALANVAKMLRPGGVFLANNTSPVILPALMNSVGYSETVYSSQLNDRDRIVWYQRR